MNDGQTLGEMISTADTAPYCFDAAIAEHMKIHLVAQLPALDTAVVVFLQNVASASPYLNRLLLQETQQLGQFLTRPVEQSFEDIIKVTQDTARAGDPEKAKARLRRQKSHMAMLLALLDLSGSWTDVKVMKALSTFADEAVRVAFELALRAQTGTYQEALPEPVQVRLLERLLERSGIAVLAMGKHGAGELNYSSDIDLVIFYDPEKVTLLIADHVVAPRLQEPRVFMVHVVQMAVAVLQDQTPDGYVFRTDLRLRPNPGASAIAVTLAAAERYYEAYGQNWERAACIKARFVAGQKCVADDLQKILTPFIWRKYLDYAAIQDIHSIKRQIHAAKGSANFRFAGHDIKVGRGGIREIEFFVQTQQLILGGKNENLREPTTLGILKILAQAGKITAQAATELSDAYLFLRHIEHRIQMINDEQSHTIPKSDENILRLANLSGYKDGESFKVALLQRLHIVHHHYADLFYEAEPLSDMGGSLVFTGVEDDRETLITLDKMGFQDPEFVSGMIRKWQGGDMRSTRTPRAREILTRLIPSILRVLTKAELPDEAFRAFDAFLRRMPTGIQVFSMLENNLNVLDTLSSLVDLSPRLTQQMATHTPLVEALLDKAFLNDGVVLDTDSLSAKMLAEDVFEEAMNVMRRGARQKRFATSCRVLLSDKPVDGTASAFTAIADSIVQAALPVAPQSAGKSAWRH